MLVLDKGKVVETDRVAAIIDHPSHAHTRQLPVNARTADLFTRADGLL